MQLNVNTDAVVKFTNKLEQMHRSDFPIAVRSTLNSIAFDVKKNTLQRSVNEHFTIRDKTFFRAFSRVDQAKGFDVKNMRAITGMNSEHAKNSMVGNDLESQEYSGKVGGRSFIPTDVARVGNKKSGKVRRNYLISGIKNLVRPRNAIGVNRRQKFVKSVIYAGKGGFVLGNIPGKEILWRVNSLNKTATGNFKLTPLFSWRRKRSVNLGASGFMKSATTKSSLKAPQFYIREAKRRFEKALSK